MAGHHKDGMPYEMETVISPVRNERGNIVSYIVAGRNIAEQLELETKYRHSQKMEAIGTLAGGIAHDFNNILMSILGFADIALHRAGDNQLLQNNLKEIIRAGERASDLVKQILVFSREREKEYRPILLQPIIKEVLLLLRGSLPSTIAIHREITDDCGLVMGDSTQVYQILMNLCTNAYHAMKNKGGILSVCLDSVDPYSSELIWAERVVYHPSAAHTESEQEQTPVLNGLPYARITVRDTGCGMSRDIMNRIFDPFFTTKAVGEGTGLGLSTAHGIVHSMGGFITVQSTEGTGSEFSVYLPQTEQFIPYEVEKVELSVTGTERILLVDDEESIVQIEQEFLQQLGYAVTAFTDSALALDAFIAAPLDFDLLITDLTMPKITGMQLAEEILQIQPSISVIVITGYSETPFSGRAKQLGIKEIIIKPIMPERLSTIIRKVLDDQKE